MSILIEHFAGNFPFWLAPVQVSVLPIGENQHDFAREVAQNLESAGLRTHVDLRNEKINRKIAESEQKKIPYALIIGQKEVDSQSVSVRRHTKGDCGSMPLGEIVGKLKEINNPGATE